MFKNVLKTFEAEIIKIFKNIQPHRFKKLRVLEKEYICIQSLNLRSEVVSISVFFKAY